MKEKSKYLYSRCVKLGPALGDWTTLKFQDLDMDEIKVSQIKSVNFDSFSREELRQLHLLHYRIAEDVVSKISQDMDIKIELHTVKASQVNYEDFLKEQESKLIKIDYQVESVGDISLLLDWHLADMMINRLMGGDGEKTDKVSFSDMEKVILESQVEGILQLLHMSWGRIFNLKDVNTEFFSGDYQYDPKVSLREAYVAFSFSFYFGKGELCSLTLAYSNSVLRKLWAIKSQLKSRLTPMISLKNKTIKGIKVDINAVLGYAKLTMSEIQDLQVGDVVNLDTALSQPIELRFGGDCILQAQPGQVDDKVVLEVLKPYNAQNANFVVDTKEDVNIDDISNKDDVEVDLKSDSFFEGDLDEKD